MNVKRREGIWTPSIGKGVHPTHKVIQMTRKKKKGGDDRDDEEEEEKRMGRGGGDGEGRMTCFLLHAGLCTGLRYHNTPVRKEWRGEVQRPTHGDVKVHSHLR